MTKANESTEPVSPTTRTSQGLRDMLFDEIDLLREGKSSAQRANAIGRLAAGVVDSVKMELDMAKYLNGRKAAPGPELLAMPGVTLGSAG